MTHKKNTTDLTELLLKCMAQPDPMLSMLEWLCPRLMETEVFPVSLAQKRMHTIHPAVITAAAIGRVDWISNLSHSQVIEMTKGLNEQVQYFRSRPLTGRYPVIWTNALYEKIRMDGRVVSMAVMVICGVNEQGRRDILAVEPMLEESKESYSQLFESLLDRGLKIPLLVISDANKGLIAAIRESFPGAFWHSLMPQHLSGYICAASYIYLLCYIPLHSDGSLLNFAGHPSNAEIIIDFSYM
jgi:putative transposase